MATTRRERDAIVQRVLEAWNRVLTPTTNNPVDTRMADIAVAVALQDEFCDYCHLRCSEHTSEEWKFCKDDLRSIKEGAGG